MSVKPQRMPMTGDSMSEGRRIGIQPATGVRLELVRGQTLRIIDIEGGQVVDLMAVFTDDSAD